MALNIYWIKELCLIDVSGCQPHNRNYQAQPIPDRFDFASRGHLAMSAVIWGCHSLRGWLARVSDISGHYKILKV